MAAILSEVATFFFCEKVKLQLIHLRFSLKP